MNATNVLVHREELRIHNLLLTHEPLEHQHPDVYNLAGHIHPGARLYGKGRQALLLPCFSFWEKTRGLLPAFGFVHRFYYPVRVAKGDQVYVIVEGEVIEVSKEEQVKWKT